MSSFRNGQRKIGVLRLETEGLTPVIELKLMFEEGLAALNAALNEHEIIRLHLDDDDNYTVPEWLRESFGTEPVMIFLYLDTHGCHLTVKRASSENAPLFRKERIGDKIRVYALNDEAQEILLYLLGGGGRAILTLHQDITGPYVEPIARPAGKLPTEMYQVTFTVHAGTEQEYTDRETCSREELIDYIENPHYTKLQVEIL